MRLTVFGFLFLGTALLISGCGRFIKTDPDVLSGKKKIAIVWDYKDTSPNYVRTGQGLLDQLTSEMTKAPWIGKIETFNPAPIINGEFERLWKPELTKRGIDFKVIKDPAYLSELRLDPAPKNDRVFFADLTQVPGVKGADYVVIYEIKSFKVTHDHAILGLAALSPPEAVLEYRVTVVRTADNYIVGEAADRTVKKFEDGWDKGPDYLGIHKALIGTISDSMNAIYKRSLGE